MTTNIKTLHKILETLATHDEESKKDYFSNFGVHYSVPESFSQMFGFAFSEENISKAIEQLQNEKETFNETNREITSNENERKLSSYSITMNKKFLISTNKQIRGIAQFPFYTKKGLFTITNLEYEDFRAHPN
ncbi:16562_t:CDS:2 [Gigaspora margarita]|uniref:16562_t:CDS:1 n=1 Tax=Gigaspora margarita TaxID=4874 RepID=A0ABN7WJ17_GIGMA|nr:16562_t:CDS:2 [Gigaspora margarita]